jgi:hypothetical protein
MNNELIESLRNLSLDELEGLSEVTKRVIDNVRENSLTNEVAIFLRGRR